MQPRDYQTKGIDEIRNRFREGKRKVLLWLATGAGKTFMFSRMVKEVDSRGKNAIVVVRGRKLVDQASQRLIRENVSHGVMMNAHWNYRPHLPVQVCSIDTLMSRGLRPAADLIIIDEAHMAVSKGYRQFISDYPNAFVVSVTATPYGSGLRHIADTIVHPITMLQLIDSGYLVPFRYFAPSQPDLSGVRVSPQTHDYVNSELEVAMNGGGLTGNIVDHWRKIASTRPTILFAVNIHHSKLIVDRFNAVGITAEHCDADTSDLERQAIIGRLESGVTKVVSNVGILSTGVDIPAVSCIVMARPTKSKNLFIQQAGRGTRTFDGKSDCILLDHAGNIGRHGLPTDEPEIDLDGREIRRQVKLSKCCKNCFAVYRAPLCPECGIVISEEAPIPEETDDELKELVGVELDPVLREYRRLQREGDQKGRHRAWAQYQLINKFTFDVASKYLDAWFVERYLSSNAFKGSPFVGFKKSSSTKS